MLQKPYPKNLATIPACHKCNERFSEDEEVVEAVLAHVSFEEDLMRERRGGKVARAIDRNPKLKASTEGQTDENGRFRVTKKTLGKVSRVAEKTVQGLYFRRYERMLAPQDVTVLAIEHQHQVSVDQMIKQFCGPESWPDVTRDGKALERAALAHLGDIKVDWEDYQPGVFRFAFFKGRRSRLVCLLDLHQTLVVAVECPRPPSR
ncbi:MAG: hypothetical protein NTV86_11965 [Planctomycetota bacterium]|nr:hypothetical protein [Planctomycetota bacterium]